MGGAEGETQAFESGLNARELVFTDTGKDESGAGSMEDTPGDSGGLFNEEAGQEIGHDDLGP
jgi:hypothetical protein